MLLLSSIKKFHSFYHFFLAFRSLFASTIARTVALGVDLLASRSKHVLEITERPPSSLGQEEHENGGEGDVRSGEYDEDDAHARRVQQGGEDVADDELDEGEVEGADRGAQGPHRSGQDLPQQDPGHDADAEAVGGGVSQHRGERNPRRARELEQEEPPADGVGDGARQTRRDEERPAPEAVGDGGGDDGEHESHQPHQDCAHEGIQRHAGLPEEVHGVGEDHVLAPELSHDEHRRQEHDGAKVLGGGEQLDLAAMREKRKRRYNPSFLPSVPELRVTSKELSIDN